MTKSERPVAKTNLRKTTPSLLCALFGHATAGVIFWFTFRDPALRSLWLLQFYVLLLLSLVLTVYAIRLSRDIFRIIALLNVLVIQIVIGYPEGADLTVKAVLGTGFVLITMLEVEGPAAYLVSIAYPASLALNQLPLTAWDIAIERPSLEVSALTASYLCFLAWFGGRVGNQAHALRRQREELSRLDRTVTALSNANLDFQEWGTRLQRETEEQERKRVAREIHDIVGHTLTNIQMMMEAATDLAQRDLNALETLLLSSRDQAQRGLLETRRAMRNLRSVTTVQPQGMRRIAEVVKFFENATKVEVDLHIGNAPASFGGEIDDVLYRMVQEGLTNAFRHGNASRVSVGFWVTKCAVRVTIKDNGVGSNEVVPGVGLVGMVERLAHLGGELKTDSNRYGFSVLAEIPLRVEKEA